MGEELERRIGQLGGLLLLGVLVLGVAELVGVVDRISLRDFLVLFFGLGISMTILRWWAS